MDGGRASARAFQRKQVWPLRDVLSGLQDLHISITGHRMNEIMKELTIIAGMLVYFRRRRWR